MKVYDTVNKVELEATEKELEKGEALFQGF